MPEACEGCAQLRDQLQRQSLGVEELLTDLKNAEVALRIERRKVAQLKKELADQQKARPLAEDAKLVFDYWNQRLRAGRAKAFSGKREKNVLDRLSDDYTISDLVKAIDGAQHDCYVRPDGKRFDDLEFICRDPTTVERFMDAEDRRLERTQAAIEIMAFGEEVDWAIHDEAPPEGEASTMALAGNQE